MAQFDPSKAVALDPGFENTGDVFVSSDLTPEEVKQAQSVLGSGTARASKFNPALSKPVEEKPASENGLWRAIKQAVLPTLGGVAGAAGGGLISGPSILGVPAGVIGGEMAGAAAGEKLNQMLGITEPSTSAVVTSGLAAPVGRAGGAALKGIFNTAVKTFAGRDIMSEGAQALLSKWLNPSVPASQMFDQAAGMNIVVPTVNTVAKIDDVLAKEGLSRSKNPISQSIIDFAKGIRPFYGGRGQALSVADLMEEEQRFRFLASQAYNSGNSKVGNAINSIRNAIFDDLEASGAGVVREASKAYRKEMAIENLHSLIAKAHPGQKIRDFMKNNPLFEGAFDQAEKDQMFRIAEKLAYIPPSGGSGVFGKTVLGHLGLSAGGVPGALLGAFGPDALRALLRTQFGRNYTERILSASPPGQGLTADTMAALAVFARGMMATPAKQETAQ